MNEQEEFDYDTLQPPCCLVAEDSPTIKKYYAALLSKMKINFIICTNGEEAIYHLGEMEKKNKIIDFMIIDIMMPKVNGMELLSKIKEMPLYKETPIIISSAVSDKEIAIKIVKEFSPQAYLLKPLETNKFIATVKGVLANAGKN